VRASFKKLALQYFQYGYWKVYVNKKLATVTTLRQLVPFVFFVVLMSEIFLSPFSSIAWLAFRITLLIYFSAGLVAALAYGRKPMDILQLLLSFFILHFCYGAGYAEGILNFILLGKKPSSEKQKLTR
jgi:hypothetical protein